MLFADADEAVLHPVIRKGELGWFDTLQCFDTVDWVPCMSCIVWNPALVIPGRFL